MTAETLPAVSSPAAPVHRYHPVQVILHWLIAALIILTALLAGGGEGEGRRAAAGIGGISTLGVHMILGITVLVLLAIRLVVRWRIKPPEWATTGSSLLDLVGRWTHIALYFFAFAVTITGLILALQTNRLARVFSPSGTGPVPTRPGSAARISARAVSSRRLPWRRGRGRVCAGRPLLPGRLPRRQLDDPAAVDHPARGCRAVSPVLAQG